MALEQIEIVALTSHEVDSSSYEEAISNNRTQNFHWGRFFKYLKSKEAICLYSIGLLNLGLSILTAYLTYDLIYPIEKKSISSAIFTGVCTLAFAGGGTTILWKVTRKAIKNGYSNN